MFARTVAASLAVVGLVLTVASPAAAAPGWQSTGTMDTARRAHVAVELNHGHVLVASGYSSTLGEVPQAELWDPTTGTWSPAAPPLVPRHYATGTKLRDGRVLLAGGYTASGITTHVELYDPAANTWTATGALSRPRNGHTATLLNDGRVLVAGGSDGARDAAASAELYDPATGTWSPAGTFVNGRENHQATLLPDGRVLIAGGFASNPSLTFLDTTAIYDPTTNDWTTTAKMSTPRAQMRGGVVAGGTVLVAGGVHRSGFVNMAERFDPVAGTWSPAGVPGVTGNISYGAALRDGRFLLTADGSRTTPLYDPHDGPEGRWTSDYATSVTRSLASVTLLRDGRVLVAGGSNHATAEVFTPPPVSPGPPVDPEDPPSAGPLPLPVLPPADPAPDRPAVPAGCTRPYVTLVEITASGTSRTPTVRLSGLATPSLAGTRVTVLRGTRRVGSTRVAADGRVVVTLAAPRDERTRNSARYRLRISGSVQSAALKATRRLSTVAQKRLADGRVKVSGRVAGVRRRTTLEVRTAPVCGPRVRGTRVRTDQRGRFTVTVGGPPTGVPAVVHRVWLQKRSVTLPVVVLAKR